MVSVTVNSRRLIVIVYVVLLTALGVAASALLLETRAEYNQLKLTEVENKRRLAEAELLWRQKEKTLERLRTDPDYVEKVIRKQLGWAKPDEIVVKFKD